MTDSKRLRPALAADAAFKDARGPMDTPQPEEDDSSIALDPLDVVERVLAAENLTFDRTEDGDLAFALAGDWKDYELWFAWRPEADCLQLCLSHRLDAPTIPARAAPTSWSIWSTSGSGSAISRSGPTTARSSSATPWPCRTASGRRLAQAASMIDAAMEAADRFYPAFDFLLAGGKTPDEAMAACMFETVGQA